jgi:formylglycine-generating enzyme required for sulfatase activity
MEPIRIFISYANNNAHWLSEWESGEQHIPNRRSLLKQWERALHGRNVVFWYDRENDVGVRGGEEWEKRIIQELDRADIAVLLVTLDFCLSPFIKNKELPKIMARYRHGDLLVLPVSAQPAREKDLEPSGVLKLQFTPDFATPLSDLEISPSTFEKAKIRILDALEKLVESVENRRGRVKAILSREKDPKPVYSQTDQKPQPYSPTPPEGMTWIDGGTFMMGSVAGNDKPVHQVTVSGFYMGITPVTQAEYEAVMGVNPSRFLGEGKRPVENVTWFDAVLYCNKRSKLEGLKSFYRFKKIKEAGRGCYDLTGLSIDLSNNGYRLPTEAEWEYACRAGTLSDYYWGNSVNGDYFWYNDNSKDQIHPVGLKRANAWGLYDMSGNVSEWCYDWHNKYQSGSVINPIGPDHSGLWMVLGDYRVLRGGCWEDNARSCRSASRSYSGPHNRHDFVGFRLSRSQ